MHLKGYPLYDGLIKCSRCGCKYRIKIILDDLRILHYFSLQIPVNQMTRDLKLQ
jgi:hypothetical protein